MTGIIYQSPVPAVLVSGDAGPEPLPEAEANGLRLLLAAVVIERDVRHGIRKRAWPFLAFFTSGFMPVMNPCPSARPGVASARRLRKSSISPIWSIRLGSSRHHTAGITGAWRKLSKPGASKCPRPVWSGSPFMLLVD